MRSGWCIEHKASAPSSPLYFSTSMRWTSNHLEAVRFADKEAAQAVLKDFFNEDYHRIAEHIWD